MADDFEANLANAIKSIKDRGYRYDISLKEEQKRGIKQLFEKKDLMAILPTGFGKSMVFQMLAVMSKVRGEDGAVLVVCPLQGIITDQMQEAQEMGLTARDLSALLDTVEEIESSKCNVLFASAESATHEKFLGFMKSNSSFRNRLLACVVDESHTVCTWSGLRQQESKRKKQARKNVTAFRGAYGQLSLLRSFFEKHTPIAALTGTADASTQKLIVSQLGLHSALELTVSPNRINIRFSVIKVKKAEMLPKLDWLVQNVRHKGTEAEKSIIFCNTMNDIACLVNLLMLKLGTAAFSPPDSSNHKDCLVGVYHSTSWPSTKEHITQSLKGQGKVRVVVTTTALSMGVNFPDIRYIINWGPARTILDQHQEAGRAGRDGLKSHNIIYCHGQQLSHCEDEIKAFVNSTGCLRVAAYASLDENIQSVKPGHECCSHCHTKCKCNGAKCKEQKPVFESAAKKKTVTAPTLSRPVSEEDKEDLKSALMELGDKLSSSTFAVFDITSSHGFSSHLVEDVVNNASHLFSVPDILDCCPVYAVEHAILILEVIQEIFLDIPDFDAAMESLRNDGVQSSHSHHLESLLADCHTVCMQPDSSSDEDDLQEVLGW